MKLNEIKSAAEMKTIYVHVAGVWEDEDGGDIHEVVAYAIDVPADQADAILAKINDDGTLDKLNDTAIDDYEQDFAPDEAEGHAVNMDVLEADFKKPSRGGKIIKNGYRMVYALRDAGVLDDKHAKKIANTKY